MNLEQKIEAILFFKNEPVSSENLAKLLKKSTTEIGEALVSLERNLENRGVKLLQNNGQASLGTTPEISGLIEELIKEELSRELGKAGTETLSIILYKGPLTRAEVDWIRGVNSSFILRNLLIRGLVEREVNPRDRRTYLYKSTFQLLSYLGVTKKEDLPDFAEIKQKLEDFEKNTVQPQQMATQEEEPENT